MTQEEDTGVEAEMQPEAAVQENEHSEAPTAKSESDQDKNWRMMREQMEELKRHNYRLENELNTIKQPSPQEEEFTATDEDLSTVGITKKLAQKEATKIAKEMMAKKDAELAEKFARLQYSDYDSVVSNENLQRLVQTAPELAKMVMANPDPVGAYKLLKMAQIDASEVGLAQKNQEKPRSVQSAGQTTALSQAHAFAKGLTPDIKKQLWQEMQEVAKSR